MKKIKAFLVRNRNVIGIVLSILIVSIIVSVFFSEDTMKGSILDGIFLSDRDFARISSYLVIPSFNLSSFNFSLPQ